MSVESAVGKLEHQLFTWQNLETMQRIVDDKVMSAEMAKSLSLSMSFVLFNDAWSQRGHSVSNTRVVLASSYLCQLLLHIIITFTITFSHLFLLLMLYFLTKVYFFEEGKNMGIINKTSSNVFAE